MTSSAVILTFEMGGGGWVGGRRWGGGWVGLIIVMKRESSMQSNGLVM